MESKEAVKTSFQYVQLYSDGGIDFLKVKFGFSQTKEEIFRAEKM